MNVLIHWSSVKNTVINMLPNQRAWCLHWSWASSVTLCTFKSERFSDAFEISSIRLDLKITTAKITRWKRKFSVCIYTFQRMRTSDKTTDRTSFGRYAIWRDLRTCHAEINLRHYFEVENKINIFCKMQIVFDAIKSSATQKKLCIFWKFKTFVATINDNF